MMLWWVIIFHKENRDNTPLNLLETDLQQKGK